VALAGELAGEDLKATCLRGPEKKLVRTRLLQPLLVAVSLGYLRRLRERGVQPDLVLGHSLGEITALAAAGVVTLPDAVRIAAKRGALMDEAAARVDGAMLAVTLKDRSRLLDWLAGAQSTNQVTLANDNAATQVVLSGERSALTACAGFITGEKLGQCRLLAVSGPWHSPFMAEAAARFDTWLRQIPMQPPQLPMLLNVTAARAETAGNIRSRISSVLAGTVRWTECMTALRGMNPRWLFEVGPGRVLAGLARANGFGGSTRILGVSNLRGVECAAQTLRAASTELRKAPAGALNPAAAGRGGPAAQTGTCPLPTPAGGPAAPGARQSGA
jgi:[acyl-carrier-protein] S-malonyltransferase